MAHYTHDDISSFIYYSESQETQLNLQNYVFCWYVKREGQGFSHQLNKIILASCYIKSRKILTCLSETFLPIKPLLDSHFFVYGTEPNNNETKHVVFNCLPCCLFWQNFNLDIIKFLNSSGFILLGVEWQLAFI